MEALDNDSLMGPMGKLPAVGCTKWRVAYLKPVASHDSRVESSDSHRPAEPG